jgi:hypothetical protein
MMNNICILEELFSFFFPYDGIGKLELYNISMLFIIIMFEVNESDTKDLDTDLSEELSSSIEETSNENKSDITPKYKSYEEDTINDNDDLDDETTTFENDDSLEENTSLDRDRSDDELDNKEEIDDEKKDNASEKVEKQKYTKKRTFKCYPIEKGNSQPYNILCSGKTPKHATTKAFAIYIKNKGCDVGVSNKKVIMCTEEIIKDTTEIKKKFTFKCSLSKLGIPIIK